MSRGDHGRALGSTGVIRGYGGQGVHEVAVGKMGANGGYQWGGAVEGVSGVKDSQWGP